MQIRPLGSSGGIGDGGQTTAFLIDEDLLLDAGTGLTGLSLAQMGGIRDVLLTHAHLDHVAGLGLLADTLIGTGHPTIRVHGLRASLNALQQHIFNGTIWPDFTRLPTPEQPVLSFHPLDEDRGPAIGGRRIQQLPAHHGVPATGYWIDDGRGAVAFTGDTGRCPALWEALNALPRLDALIIECAFADAYASLGEHVGHYTPSALVQDAQHLRHKARIWLTHLKPAQREIILQELDAASSQRPIQLIPEQPFQVPDPHGTG